MNIERIVQIHVAVLASLGALFLSMGKEAPPLYWLVAVSAGLSLIFTDWLGWLRLHRGLANLAALLALGLSMNEFFSRANTNSQLLAIANLLIYLQSVLFFQQKSPRIYWQLMVLSLLEVVVAAVLQVGAEFGLLLAIYSGCSLSTLVFFYLHREVSLAAPKTSAKSKTAPVLLASPRLLSRRQIGRAHV